MQNKVKLYLTSSPFGNYRTDSGEPDYPGFNPENGLLEELRKDWPENARVLLVSADPYNMDGNDMMLDYFKGRIAGDELSTLWVEIFDARNADLLIDTMSQFDVIIFGGGHVPTMNSFLHEYGVAEALLDFEGIVMGISAGSMNCAETVYASPEEPGEAVDPDYERYLPGLGLTECQIMPHYQAVRWDVLDGLRLVEDILCPDSMGNCFIALPDGSFILQREGVPMLCGPGYFIQEGAIFPVGRPGSVTAL